MKTVKIHGKSIGKNQTTFVIAEIGGNFYTYEDGKKIVDAAIKNGANAVKIQTFSAENLVSKYATFNLPVVGGKKKQFEILKDLELSKSIQKKLIQYCRKKNIIIFSSPSHITDVDFLEKCNVPAHKLGSDDMTNIPLIKYISKCGKPTIMSTGMSSMKEVKEAVKAFFSTGNKKLILLHCVSMYPSEPEFTNLNAIHTMQKQFQIPIGWSDHTKGIDVCIGAVALGANIIEKHFMLNKKSSGPDSVLSANPNEFNKLVKAIRIIEQSKGTGTKMPAKNELSIRKDIRKSVVAIKNIPKGTKITKNSVDVKRPGTGLSPTKLSEIIGKIAKRDILNDNPIMKSDIIWK
jgi:N,N'-diacetyllegionaminate synthase